MPATENQPPPYAAAGVSMRDLLASCAAAAALSRPPSPPEPAPADPRPAVRGDPRTVEGHRQAA
jgi:hypothetical protein